MGEKSSPPIGGMIFLNGFKTTSATIATVLNGWLYQFIEGIHVKNILTSTNQK